MPAGASQVEESRLRPKGIAYSCQPGTPGNVARASDFLRKADSLEFSVKSFS